MFPQLSNTYKELCNNDLFVRKLVRSFKQPVYRFFFPTSNCECSVFFFKKIQLSGFSACPVGSPSQLIRISGVLLHAGFLFLFNLRRSQYLKGLCCLVLPENIVLLSAAISWQTQHLYADWDAKFNDLLECEFDVHRAVHRNVISIVNPTRCTNISNFILFGVTLQFFFFTFIVTPCMLSSYSIITPTTAHISNL